MFGNLFNKVIEKYKLTMENIILLTGEVSFVNYDKNFVQIDYEVNKKKKQINGQIAKTEKHFYQIGDVVTFTTELSTRGDKMIAANVEYKYNTALEVLLNKAKTENDFLGFLKAVGDKFFVKELKSYLFFEVPISPWQQLPKAELINDAVRFMLENVENINKIKAKLYDNKYIPEYRTALKCFKEKTALDVVVSKITPHGTYVNVVGEKVQAKIKIESAKVGDVVRIVISHLTPFKIAVVVAD
jgi:hypothetical protein